MKIWTILLILVIVIAYLYWFTSGQNNNNQNKSTNLPVSNVDLTKYQGLWYEIARLPTIFQRGCFGTTATYTLNTDKTINVSNQCQIGNQIVLVNGIAYPNYAEVRPGSNIYPGSFTVVFGGQNSNSTKGDYNVILVDPNYSYALVGTKDRKNLWILSRSNKLDQITFNNYVKIAHKLGYPTNNLILDALQN